MKTYKITDIIEDEFGCEGRPEGEEPMVTILLVDDTGKQRSIRMADKLAYEKKLDIGAEMELPEEEIMTLNGKEYKVKKLLGKGKGGYSYLVMDGEKEYVLKQIHHEPCSYYQFDNKLEAEKRDYKRLMEIGITMPKLLDIDETQERILKEYIPGDTVYQQVEKDALPEICLQQVKEMCTKLYAAHTNIDYFPTNFILWQNVLYYVDYECNAYMEEWNFENWGIKYWSKTKEFLEYERTH